MMEGSSKVQSDWAQNIVVGFGHLSGGNTVGIVAESA